MTTSMDLGSRWNVAFVALTNFSRPPTHGPMAVGKEKLSGDVNENLCPKFESSSLLKRNSVLYITTQP